MMKKLLRKLRAPRGIVPILGVALLSIPLGSFGNDREAYAERGSFSIPVGLTAKDTTLDLSGQWYFRYGEWIDPAEILQTFRDSPNFIDVPSSWRSLNEAPPLKASLPMPSSSLFQNRDTGQYRAHSPIPHFGLLFGIRAQTQLRSNECSGCLPR